MRPGSPVNKVVAHDVHQNGAKAAGEANRHASAQHRSDAREPTLWSENAVRQTLQVASGEWKEALSDAWRSCRIGGSTGKQERTEAWTLHA